MIKKRKRRESEEIRLEGEREMENKMEKVKERDKRKS